MWHPSLSIRLRLGLDGPSRQRALLALAGESIGANTAVRRQELWLELPPLEQPLLLQLSLLGRPPRL